MFFLMLGLICTEPATFSQLRGLGTISKKELKYNLDFLGAVEFRGRETPSPELEIATLPSNQGSLDDMDDYGDTYEPEDPSVLAGFFDLDAVDNADVNDGDHEHN